MSAARPQARRYRRADDWLLAQLPSWMLDDDLFRRFAAVFQTIATTYVDQVDQLEHVFDPTVAPPHMVGVMARWIGVGFIDAELDAQRHRQILLEMAQLSRWRGTRYGLQRVLELVTGEAVNVDESGSVHAEGEAPPGQPGHAEIRVQSNGWVDEDNLLEIIRRELPFSVTFDLWIGDRRVWPKGPSELELAGPTACPVCGAPTTLGEIRMAADEFCPVCDFPLFWTPDDPHAHSEDAIGATSPRSVQVDRPLVAGVRCPRCGSAAELQTIRMAADEFCQDCDFPLFWAPDANATG
jgi:phage tail-like protein